MKKGSLIQHKDKAYTTMTVLGFSDKMIPERSIGHVKSDANLSDDSSLEFVVCEFLKPPCDHRICSFRRGDLILIKE